jgi:uncharacterized damage-inducible protein DinB
MRFGDAEEEASMSQRSQALVNRFERASQEMIATVERCSDAHWTTKTSSEAWSVGVVAHHVAQGHEAIAGFVKMIATGQPLPPLTMDTLHQMNAEHAKQYANCTKAETLALLRKNAAAAAGILRELSDEQLDRSAPVLGGPPMTAEQMVEQVLVGHMQEHHGSIRATMGAT